MAINANPNEYKSFMGVDEVYVAEVLQDDADDFVTGTPELLAPVGELTPEVSYNRETQYADNKPFDMLESEGDSVLGLVLTGIPAEMQAKLRGKTFDAATGRVFDSVKAVAPYFALGFRSLKSGGGQRYYWYLKGKFGPPSESFATKTDTPDPKTSEIEYVAVETEHQFSNGSSAKRVWGDDDTTNFDDTGWFSAVQTPESAAPSALALSSSTPTDGATGVVVTSNLTLTFNNALQNAAINSVNLIKVTSGAVIAAAKTLNTAKKIMTIDPTASLDASSDYFISIAVTDVFGQTLNSVINFTTA